MSMLGVKPRILFSVLSSRDTKDAICQLADLLFPHQIIVHHDFTKFPDYKIDKPNVYVLEDPVVTSWGGWSLVDATLKLMEVACSRYEFEYFQLLSESCLPIKSISELEAYLNRYKPDATIDLQPLIPCKGPEFYSHGWRYLTIGKKTRYVARKLYYYQKKLGSNIQIGLVNSIALDRSSGLLTKLAFNFTLALSYVFLSFCALFSVKNIAVGGQWFGVSRTTLSNMIDYCSSHPELLERFKSFPIPDESFFQTIINHVGCNKILPPLHGLSWRGGMTGPDLLTDGDVDDLMQANDKFFARKFSLEPSDPARSVVCSRLNTPCATEDKEAL